MSDLLEQRNLCFFKSRRLRGTWRMRLGPWAPRRCSTSRWPLPPNERSTHRPRHPANKPVLNHPCNCNRRVQVKELDVQNLSNTVRRSATLQAVDLPSYQMIAAEAHCLTA